MKVITLLSIFVVFYLINGIIACSSKEYMTDEPENITTKGFDALLQILGKSSTTQGKEDDQEEEEFAADDDMSAQPANDLFGVDDAE